MEKKWRRRQSALWLLSILLKERPELKNSLSACSDRKLAPCPIISDPGGQRETQSQQPSLYFHVNSNAFGVRSWMRLSFLQFFASALMAARDVVGKAYARWRTACHAVRKACTRRAAHPTTPLALHSLRCPVGTSGLSALLLFSKLPFTVLFGYPCRTRAISTK